METLWDIICVLETLLKCLQRYDGFQRDTGVEPVNRCVPVCQKSLEFPDSTFLIPIRRLMSRRSRMDFVLFIHGVGRVSTRDIGNTLGSHVSEVTKFRSMKDISKGLI